MKNLLVLAFLSSVSLMACAKPEVDCAVFPEQQNSLYVLPYEIGTSHQVNTSSFIYFPTQRSIRNISSRRANERILVVL